MRKVRGKLTVRPRWCLVLPLGLMDGFVPITVRLTGASVSVMPFSPGRWLHRRQLACGIRALATPRRLPNDLRAGMLAVAHRLRHRLCGSSTLLRTCSNQNGLAYTIGSSSERGN